MKIFQYLFNILFLAISFCKQYTEFEIRSMYEDFKIRYSKSYTYQENIDKYTIFKQNLKVIEELNQSEEGSAEYGITKFADMTQEEFQNKILMKPQEPKNFTKSRYAGLKKIHKPAPDTFDYRQQGAVSPVKNQGWVGTCWAFSTTGNIEGQWYLATKNLTNLSEEQIVDCSSEIDPTSDFKANCGVYGGWPYLAFEYVIKAGGLPETKSYPYCAGDNSCYVCSPPGYNSTRCGPPVPDCNTQLHDCYQGKFPVVAKIEDWKAIPQDEDVMKQSLFEMGPLSVALNGNLLQFYKKGVFYSRFCNKQKLSHAVLVVGYGTEPKSLFKNETPYWIVKNSWGFDWGEEGYFRIRRGTGECGINTAVTTSIVNKAKFEREFFTFSDSESVEIY